jgi:hypothetical protein
MSNSKPRIKTYDGYQDILENVRQIIRMKAPEESVIMLVNEINEFEDVIEETISGRHAEEDS